MSSGDREFCPYFQRAIELIGKRWTGAVLRELLDGPRRFSQIASRIPQISDRALSVRLKELEREGVVVRRVEATQPVSVVYGLTEKGFALEATVAAVEVWANDWMLDTPRVPAGSGS